LNHGESPPEISNVSRYERASPSLMRQECLQVIATYV
jgi:hypothetical protein